MTFEVLLDDDDIIKIDMTTMNVEWEYSKFECKDCSKSFALRKGLKTHYAKSHSTNESIVDNVFEEDEIFYGEKENEVSKHMHTCKKCGFRHSDLLKISLHIFNAHEKALQSCLKNREESDEHCQLRKEKISVKFQDGEKDEPENRYHDKYRLFEIHEEREKNEKWRKLKHETDECDVFQAEVTENETNKNLCDDAKEKELTNFENYNVFEEVPFDNQKVLGTRFVLTKKNRWYYEGKIRDKKLSRRKIQHFKYSWE